MRLQASGFRLRRCAAFMLLVGCGSDPEDRSPCVRAEELCRQCELDVASCARFAELQVRQCDEAVAVYEDMCV
jgi:hypothetical protein